MAHVHAAAAHAGAAVVAVVLVYPHAHQAEAVEQPVDCAQGAEEAAEAAIAEHTGQADNEHDGELAGEEDAQHAEKARVVGVCQQADGTLKGAGRTDVLAEARNGNIVLEPIPQRNRHNEHGQRDVFQPGQRPRQAVLFQLIGGDLVQQLLDQPQRAEPPADGAAQDNAEKQDDAQHVPARPVARGGQRVLDGAQGAGAHCAGAGVAVEARDAGVLGLALVDLAVDKALQMRVVQQRAVELDQSPGGGTERRASRILDIIQGQHTPYRFLLPCQRRPWRCR